uniref:Uncharacterized protein n=1 Tax=Sarcoptes scabiei TaxID=52283 RepID=A0A834RBT8_SARSC
MNDSNDIETRIKLLSSKIQKSSNLIPLDSKESDYLRSIRKINEDFLSFQSKFLDLHPDFRDQRKKADKREIVCLPNDLIDDLSRFRKILDLI